MPSSTAALGGRPRSRRDGLSAVLARGRIRGPLGLLGPGFVAAIAYVDPGNFATNISAGARYGYLLLWVIVAANLMAVLVQYLSSKLGLVTGRSLPELCRDRYPRPIRFFLWGQAEVVAMATDLAEFIGAAIALQLLFGLGPLPSGLVTAAITLILLAVQRRGFRPYELAIAACLATIVIAFAASLAVVPLDPVGILSGLRPRLADADSVLLAVGIIGATVMPHVVYLHSALVTDRVPHRDDAELRVLLGYTRIDVVLAMCLAGAANLAMLVLAAAALGPGSAGAAEAPGGLAVDTLAGARDALAATIGALPALLFVLALLASGLSSSSVGTMAGQVVMQGFIRRAIPIWIRRLVTIAPAMVVLALGLEPTMVLILSQVILSLGIPFALIPLVHLTGSRAVMGSLTNRRALTVTAAVVAATVVTMNGLLLVILALGG
ncbi:MAG TPA: Nramp family divalent metal transporter [Candidatus Limnocylindrales bacterium]|nr:Nramp family divalent metal transporter [Candidatus Limnocylindrales bacterium]